jgi:hypothetical protein
MMGVYYLAKYRHLRVGMDGRRLRFSFDERETGGEMEFRRGVPAD